MHRFLILGTVALLGNLAAQEAAGGPAPRPKPADRPRSQGVPIDPSTGWPVVVDDDASRSTRAAAHAPAKAPVQAPAAGGEPGRTTRPRPSDTKGAKDRKEPAAGGAAARSDADDVPQLASGTQLGSPLLDIYQAIQGPGVWKQLGGVVVWWRITIYGAQGEEIGMREVTHTADTAFAERDRLQHPDGRIHGRLGAQVFAERNGMPMPTSAEQAGVELMFFGMQLRAPWLFGDANAFVVVGKDIEDRGGERLRKVIVEQRPPAGSEVIGPELDPKPRDRYELLYEPSTGVPREFVHRFAHSLQSRRVLLEDWREFEGVRLPFRRVYVDEAMRQTTALEILRIERQRVTERDFRLL